MTPAEAARVVAMRDEILAGPEFRRGPNWFETYVVPWWADASDWIRSLPVATRTLVMVALGLAVVSLLVHILVTFAREGRGASPRGAPGRNPAEVVAVVPTAADLRRDAARLLNDGAYAETIRLAWLAALAALDEAGVSRAGPGRADFEYVADVRRRATAAVTQVEALAAAFQRTHFGGEAVAAVDAERCLATLENLNGSLLGAR